VSISEAIILLCASVTLWPTSLSTVNRFLRKLGLDRRELRAWAMYDWANSAFQSTVVTAIFPPFFSSYAAAGLTPTEATSRFAWATTIAVTITAISGPFLGALADYRGGKKRLLALFVGVGVIATALMATIYQGGDRYAALLFVVANIAFVSSLVFYDSLLPHIAGEGEIDRVSTGAYAVGYLGGGILLALNLAWILAPGTFGLSGKVAAIKLSFVSVAAWWLIFSIPLLRRVPEPRAVLDRNETGQESGAFAALKRVLDTLHELRGYRQAFLMLIAFLLYSDGIQTMIRMASIYGQEIGIDQNGQIAAFVMVQFVGVPFAFLFGTMAGRIGAKTALFLALVVYTGISVLGYFMTATWQFFVLAFLVAMVQGGSQALSRSLFARMIPRDKSSEFFGFFSIGEKFAGILGPTTFALSVDLFGSSRTAVLSVVLFFILGGLVLSRVDVDQGIAEARAAQASG
jgi:UMF1 family MFS transporter